MFRKNNRIWHKGLACVSSSIKSYQTKWYNKRILRKGYSFSRDFSWIENSKLKSFCQWKFLLTKFLSGRYPCRLWIFFFFFVCLFVCLFVFFSFSRNFITFLDEIFPDDAYLKLHSRIYIRSAVQLQILWLLIFNNLR